MAGKKSEPSLGEKVSLWRRMHGLTERAAAERIGVSQPVLRKVEHATVERIGLVVAMKFVTALQGAVSLDDFANAEGLRKMAREAARKAS